jgi:ectoine hydroxylase-related dioxygenase (phytanoyl-CoA dioxygenase family)
MYGNNRPCHINYAGSVTSFPRAPAQSWHVDGEHEGCYTVFSPLIDVLVEHGGTQFKLGSHKSRQSRTITHVPKIGEIVIFDYRILHRGMANRSVQTRPLMYIVYSREESHDVANFPTTTLEERIGGKTAWFRTEKTEKKIDAHG